MTCYHRQVVNVPSFQAYLFKPPFKFKMTHWRVMLSSKRWDQGCFAAAAQLRPERLRDFAQSKGAVNMRETPVVGDFVSFVFKGHIVMTGVVRAGFQEGDLHQTQHLGVGAIGLPEDRLHALPASYALIDLALVAPRKVRHTGQATWIKMPVGGIEI